MRVGIIGSAGHWAYALNELKGHTVTGIAPGFQGEDLSSVERTLKDNGINGTVLNSVDELLSLQPEIVIINTRFDLNCRYTAECLKRNIYVFCEKPLALTENQLEALKSIKTKAFVSCMFGISFEGWCLTLREAVKNIGKVKMINARKSYKLGIRPEFYKNKKTFGGILPWVGIHAMHWIYFITGLSFDTVTATQANTDNFNNGDLETVAVATFTMENGAIATITCDYYRPAASPTWDDDRIRIVGTEGVAEYEKGKLFILNTDGERELPLLKGQDVFKLFLDRIQDSVSGVSMEESIYITHTALCASRAADTKATVKI